jgi:transposase
VAIESTGVYWIALYELLDARGFTVLLVNARHVKNVSGRKSDVLDCQWLQQLMSYGLLSGAFRPAGEVCALRAIVAGERDGQVLAAMKNVRIHASTQKIAKSLQGSWRAEHLFALKQALASFDFYGTQLAECE